MYAMKIVPPKGERSTRIRQVQEPRLSLVVAGGSGGIQCNISFVLLSGKSIFVTTVFVSNRHCIPVWLGRDLFFMCFSVDQRGGMSIARTVVWMRACWYVCREDRSP